MKIWLQFCNFCMLTCKKTAFCTRIIEDAACSRAFAGVTAKPVLHGKTRGAGELRHMRLCGRGIPEKTQDASGILKTESAFERQQRLCRDISEPVGSHFQVRDDGQRDKCHIHER